MKKKLCVVLLAAVLAASSIFGTGAVFNDVNDETPYREAIEYCAENGFVVGTGGMKFNPSAPLTREQFVAIWSRIMHFKTHDFKDVTRSRTESDNNTTVLYALGIMSGVSDNQFMKNGHFTREQLAVITTRTFYKFVLPASEKYKDYTDHALVSSWARNSVSQCLNEDLFADLYEKGTFKPQMPVTRGEICQLISNVIRVPRTITIDDHITGGTVSANKTIARHGETITLTINPDSGKQLKNGTLKFNGTPITGKTFKMPNENVTITAEFENIWLTGLEISTKPNKMSYNPGATLDLTGMVVKAVYSDGSKVATTSYTVKPVNGSALPDTGEKTVKVTYEEGDITVTAEFKVTITTPTTSSSTP